MKEAENMNRRKKVI